MVIAQIIFPLLAICTKHIAQNTRRASVDSYYIKHNARRNYFFFYFASVYTT